MANRKQTSILTFFEKGSVKTASNDDREIGEHDSGEIEGKLSITLGSHRISREPINFIAEATTEDTQSPENSSDSWEEIEDETNEMEVSDTECTVDCCHLMRDKPNQPVEMFAIDLHAI